jgi:NADH-quinone oxidoreductase subunit G
VPEQPGRDSAAILEAAARREIDVLYLIGVDPLRDFPDARLARHALENVSYKVVQDIAADHLAHFADAMLPAAAFVERDGHFTDWEGRGQRLRPVRGTTGLARPDWQILQGLSRAVGSDLGFASLEALQEEAGVLLQPRLPAEEPRSGMSWQGGAGRSAGPTPADSDGSLILFTYPLLVDEGRLSAGADKLKEALEEPPFLEVHPDDAERLGLAEGEPATVSTEAGRVVVPVRVTSHIAPGSAFVPFNQAGLPANTLLSGSFTTPASIEPANGG